MRTLHKRRNYGRYRNNRGFGATEAEQQTPSITTLEELTASFVERVEESDAKEESEVGPGPETTTADAETDQDQDVLLQSTETEESEEETEELAEEEEETEEEAEPQSKAVGKLLKQVNRLTARSKSSEELVETLKAEIASLKSNPETSKNHRNNLCSMILMISKHWKVCERRHSPPKSGHFNTSEKITLRTEAKNIRTMISATFSPEPKII